MGFSFRKSVKIGPVRVNVSKSGVGVSAGVKGARIGINSKGKVYGSVGAKGLVYRTQLSPTTKRKNTVEDKTENVAEIQKTDISAGGVGVSLIIVSLIAVPFSAGMGIAGIIIGLIVLIVSSVLTNEKKTLKMKIIQNAELSEDEIVRLLAEYCHWKKLSGEDAKQAMVAILQEREEYQNSNLGKKYHERTCRTLSRSKQISELTVEQAKARGYEPCKVCNP